MVKNSHVKMRNHLFHCVSLVTELWQLHSADKFKNERNKYHCIIISVLPIDKSLIRRECCKDYAFVYRKVERAHIGQPPQKITYEEGKLLRKIEKRVFKIIKNAEKHGVQKTCKDTFLDAIRYCSSSKYEYKGLVLGKERSLWELFFILIIGILAIALVLIYKVSL